MSTLTIRLKDREAEELKKIMLMTSCKTSSKCIVKMILKYRAIVESEHDALMKVSEMKSKNDTLKYESQKYFQSMHDLMKACEFEQKL